jgi:hypothetical protein
VDHAAGAEVYSLAGVKIYMRGRILVMGNI